HRDHQRELGARAAQLLLPPTRRHRRGRYLDRVRQLRNVFRLRRRRGELTAARNGAFRSMRPAARRVGYTAVAAPLAVATVEPLPHSASQWVRLLLAPAIIVVER